MGALDLAVRGQGTEAVVLMGITAAIPLFALAGFAVYRMIKDGPRKVFADMAADFKEEFKRPHQL